MRIELRKSGGRVCDRCGATALVSENVADASDLMEKEFLDREKELAELLHGAKEDAVEELHVHYERILDALDDRAPLYRPLRRRWEARLRALLEEEFQSVRKSSIRTK